MQENANQRLLSAAESQARNGDLNETQLKYLKAADYYQQALKIVPPKFAEKQGLYANQTGCNFYEAGKYSQAKPLYKQALKIRTETLGKKHPEMANSLNNLAALYQAQGLYEKSEPLLKRALEIQEKSLGAEHPTVATSLNNLALLYNKAQGRYEKS